ncbi:putative disease resistance RPP13-like protein 1 [Bienertia sinuspersici]
MYLKGLSDDECWLVFKQHALISDDPIEVRSQVIRLSKGLPLAAKALGGFLKKKNRRNWPTILSSDIWSEEGGVLPALRLSYYHLPHHLKRMFAYCSLFPKGYRFSPKDIVLMWMAEGFLPESEWESMENKDHSYFDDLVSRSLFEPVPYPEGCFMMHDLIHDIAQWAAGDVCSRMQIINKSSIRTRYLSISKEFFMGSPLILEKVGEEMPVGIGNLRKLQTLEPYFIIGHKSGHRIRELENLDCLSGSLFIMHLQNVKRSEDAEKARLSEKSHLEILEMHWQDVRYEGYDIATEVVNQLQPPKSLKELRFYGYIGLAFPTWLGNSSFNKMVVTKLIGCSRCKRLPPLGQLPSLKELVVENMSGITTVGLELYGAGCLSPFPSLKILKFKNMGNWEKWLTLTPSVDNNKKAFPCLEELKISRCPMLQGDIPPYLPFLKRLEIIRCNVMKVSLPSSPMLQILNIHTCQEITVNNLPLTLQVLHIEGVEIEQSAKEWELHLLTSLKKLGIRSAGSCVDSVESISSDSDGLHLPSSLTDITITGFKFLKFMSCSTFPNLTRLWIQNCPLMTVECIHNSYGLSLKSKAARGTRYIYL